MSRVVYFLRCFSSDEREHAASAPDQLSHEAISGCATIVMFSCLGSAGATGPISIYPEKLQRDWKQRCQSYLGCGGNNPGADPHA